jgi:hypothetical protein
MLRGSMGEKCAEDYPNHAAAPDPKQEWITAVGVASRLPQLTKTRWGTADDARHALKIFSIAFPLASSSINLSR